MKNQITLSLQEIADLTQGTLIGNPNHVIHGVADISQATSQQASFLANLSYQQALKKSQAGVIFLTQKSAELYKEKTQNYLIVQDPSAAFQKLIDIFHPLQALSGFTGIHPTAVIHPTAKIAPTASIGPYAVIDAEVEINEHTFIGSHVYVGVQTMIGKNCIIHPHVVIRENCQIADHVILQPGAIIGSCGYGYRTASNGIHTKLNHVGNVKIEEEVEIGANTTIDRARFNSTKIGKGTKIDNLVQIGHNVCVGSHNLIIAQSAIAGSAKTGQRVILAGQSAITGHVNVGDDVQIAAKSGVSKSLTQKGSYGGSPAFRFTEYQRNLALLRSIHKFVADVKELVLKVQKIEESLKKEASEKMPPL